MKCPHCNQPIELKTSTTLVKAKGNPGTAKAPWQMTREKWLAEKLPREREWYAATLKGEQLKRQMRIRRNELELEHSNKVWQADRTGKPVPPEVLKDYPDLGKAKGNPGPEVKSKKKGRKQ